MYTGKIERILFLEVDTLIISALLNVDPSHAEELKLEAEFLKYERDKKHSLAALEAFCFRHLGAIDMPSADLFDWIILV